MNKNNNFVQNAPWFICFPQHLLLFVLLLQNLCLDSVSSFLSLSRVRLFMTPWSAAHQAYQSTINSRTLLKLMSIESVIPFNNLIFCSPLLLLLSIFPRIRVFSNESALCIKWPKYWSFSFSISPSKEYSGLISFRIDGLISLQSKGLSKIFSKITVQKHQFYLNYTIIVL